MRIANLKATLLAGVMVFAYGTNVLADPLVIAVANENKTGVSVFTNPNVTDTEYSILTGLDGPPDAPGQTVLILEEGSPPRWTNDTLNEIDRRYGGDGTPPSQDLSKVPFQNGDVIRLSQGDDDNAPIEIFDPEEDEGGDEKGPSRTSDGDDDGLSNVADGLVLKDGLWNRIAGHTGFEGCGPKLPGQVRSILPEFPDEQRNMTFSHPFNPQTDLGFDSSMLILWGQTSPTEWTGFVELPTAGTAQAGIEFGMALELEILSAKEIEIYSTLTIRLSEFTAKLMESTTLCTATSNMALRYIGN